MKLEAFKWIALLISVLEVAVIIYGVKRQKRISIIIISSLSLMTFVFLFLYAAS